MELLLFLIHAEFYLDDTVGPNTSTRDIVIRLAQLGEICSNESPCADGLIVVLQMMKALERCQAEESSDSSDAIVPQAQPQG